MNHSSNDQIRWWEIPKSVTITSIASIIRIMGTKDCRSLWDHLDQLVRKGKLKQLLYHSSGQGSQANSEARRDVSLRPFLGTINVIFSAPGKTRSCPSKVMSVAHLSLRDINQDSKRARVEIPLAMGYSDEDKIGTI